MTIPASPLAWPDGWKRTHARDRARAKFGKQRRVYSSFKDANGHQQSYLTKGEVSVADGVGRIRAELARMGIDDDNVVISTNLRLRQDGLPRSSQGEPEDPGVAVYWTDGYDANRPPRCMAIDRYDRVADNLAAVAATLEAMRAIERHGGAEILERAFTGFTALPAPRDPWWQVLGVAPDARAVEREAAYRRLRSATHPDRGGTPEAFDAVQRAWEQARAVQ